MEVVNEIKTVLVTLAAAALLFGCGSRSLAPTDTGARDAVSIDRADPPDASVGCTPGQDLTCNDDPTAVTNQGVCLSDGTCQCLFPCVNPATGRCLNPTCGCGALCVP